MQDAQSMLTLGIVNLGRSKAVHHIFSCMLCSLLPAHIVSYIVAAANLL